MSADVLEVLPRTASAWTNLGILAAIVCVVAGGLLSNPVSTRTDSPETTASPPTALYLRAGHAPASAVDREEIATIVGVVKGSLSPVVVAGYVSRSGDPDRNLRLAQTHASDVRRALIKSGIPTMRVIVVSPTFVASSEPWRVEVSLVHAVPVFPVKPGAQAHDISP